jgi:MoaA/NifB/PqqE/SkfB family radical SAM enzyme
MNQFVQEAPFAVQVELSEGCNLYCNFCGLQGIRTIKEKNFHFMTVDDANNIAGQIAEAKWNPRIEFAMHGEPTMNPHYIEIVETFRAHLPRHHIMMTSNGGGLLRPPGVAQSLVELFEAGLNIFAFDAYEYVKIKDKIDAILFDKTSKYSDPGYRPFDIHRYPDEKEFSPHNRYGHKARKFIRVQDISVAVAGTHSSLNNHCGNGSPPLQEPMRARCAKPFRELSIRWNGDVAICCNDWRGIYKCGNVVRQGLEEVWQSATFNSARKFLMNGDRGALAPCNVCDAKSYRVGLLPDKKGKVKMDQPNDQDKGVTFLAASGSSYTEANRREWEK